MSMIYFTGFENGDTLELQNVTGTTSVTNALTRGAWSAYSFRCNPTTTGNGSCKLGPPLTSGVIGGVGIAANLAQIWSRFYIRFATLPAANSEEFFGALRTTTGSAQTTLRINSTGTISAYRAGGLTLITTGTAVLTTGIWYRIECQIGSGAGGVVEWKVDGTVDISTASTLVAVNLGGIALGKGINQNNQTVDMYFDDVAISDSGYMGAGQCGVMVASSAGTFQTWGRGGTDTGANWSQCSDLPQDGDGTYVISSATIGDAETETIHDSSLLGLSGTVNAVKGVVVAKASGSSGNCKTRFRSNTTNTDSAGFGIGTSYQTLTVMALTDPATGSAWTTSISGVQNGMIQNTTAQTLRMTASYAHVDWTPATTYTVSVTDSSTVTDSPTVSIVTPGVSLSVSVSETSQVKDTGNFSVRIDCNISVTDNPTAAELRPTVTIDENINKSESSTVTETVTIRLDQNISVSESSTVGESVTVRLTSNISVSDSSAVTDSPTVRLTSNISVSDSSTVTEIITVRLDQNINVSDSSTVTDSPQLMINQNIIVSDSSSVTDSPTLTIDLNINKSESSAVTDSPNLNLSISINVSDNSMVTDSTNVMIDFNINKSESSIVTEEVSIKVNRAKGGGAFLIMHLAGNG